ncbi:MAG: hypothetical protein NW216_14990 [Hyphomicrobium sp.]|nr:hypothetical protein [Hyphomicrobium sp.]
MANLACDEMLPANIWVFDPNASTIQQGWRAPGFERAEGATGQ